MDPGITPVVDLAHVDAAQRQVVVERQRVAGNQPRRHLGAARQCGHGIGEAGATSAQLTRAQLQLQAGEPAAAVETLKALEQQNADAIATAEFEFPDPKSIAEGR